MPLPEKHESSVRSMYNEAHGIEYTPIKSFEQAKTIKNACVIFEGDYGGQIYLTCPMKYVQCSESTLHKLWKSIDKIEWDSNDIYQQGIFYEVISVGQGVAGGMGGGRVVDGLWIHKRLENAGLREKIADIIANKRKNL